MSKEKAAYPTEEGFYWYRPPKGEWKLVRLARSLRRMFCFRADNGDLTYSWYHDAELPEGERWAKVEPPKEGKT